MAITVQVPTNIRPFLGAIPDDKLPDLHRRIAAPATTVVTLSRLKVDAAWVSDDTGQLAASLKPLRCAGVAHPSAQE